VKDPVLSDLCRRLRARALFKTVELFDTDRNLALRVAGDPDAEAEIAPEHAVSIARDLAQKAGLDPDVYVGLDVASDTPFSDDASLVVVYPKGRPRRPAEVSFVLDRLRDATITRRRVIFAPEIRDAVREALIR
jgi:uncharacterized protein